MRLRQEEAAVVVLNKKIMFAQSIFTPVASDDGRAFARNAKNHPTTSANATSASP